MSCEANGRLGASVAQRNGIMGQASRYLNTLGSWRTYRDLAGVEDIPARVAQVTETFFGLVGVEPGSQRRSRPRGTIPGAA